MVSLGQRQALIGQQQHPATITSGQVRWDLEHDDNTGVKGSKQAHDYY